MATTKEPPSEERTERISRIPKSPTRHVIRVRVPRAGSKQQKPLVALIVEAGIAQSVHEARAFIIAGEICHDWKGHETHSKKDELEWQHGKPINLAVSGNPSTVGSVLLDEDAKVVHRNKCPECKKPIVFAERDRKAASSSATHSRVSEGLEALYLSRSNFEHVTQEDLELRILRQKELTEVDERIADALSKGAEIEPGVHTAKLVPHEDDGGGFCLKLVVR
jgi:hypothetical protein